MLHQARREKKKKEINKSHLAAPLGSREPQNRPQKKKSKRARCWCKQKSGTDVRMGLGTPLPNQRGQKKVKEGHVFSSMSGPKGQGEKTAKTTRKKDLCEDTGLHEDSGNKRKEETAMPERAPVTRGGKGKN